MWMRGSMSWDFRLGRRRRVRRLRRNLRHVRLCVRGEGVCVMRVTKIFLGAVLLAGCSTGVVQMDKDTYMVSEKAGGCGFATAGGQEADAYKKANAFCAARDEHVETISSSSRNGV